LHFPKARLFAYDRLVGGASCSSAIVRAVADAGLLSADTMETLTHALDSSGGCGALNTAKQIIQSYMSERHDEGMALEHTEKAYGQICSEIDRWKSAVATAPQDQCRTEKLQISCRDMAPIVLDLLLQQIMKHPN